MLLAVALTIRDLQLQTLHMQPQISVRIRKRALYSHNFPFAAAKTRGRFEAAKSILQERYCLLVL